MFEQNPQSEKLTLAQKNGITFKRSLTFKGAIAKHGHIFYIGYFSTKKNRVTEGYLVPVANEKQYGEKAVQEDVCKQIVARHFTKVSAVAKN